MLDKDFYWCYNHEYLFRQWLKCIYTRIDYYDLDDATIFDLWQEAKKRALKIANAEEPGLFYRIRKRGMINNFSHNTFLVLEFLNTMLTSTKNKKLESFANSGDKKFKAYSSEKKIDKNSIDKLDTKSFNDLYINILISGQIESDYDYSLPDGGIKDETITDETKTITKADAGTAENNETLLEKLMPIFYGNKEQAEVYIKKLKNITNDVEKVQYTAQLVNENTISERSCHRVLYRILHDHGLYNKTETNWNKVISQHLVKKINKQL